MKTYILLLRGINVSGQKKIKMADLKKLLEALNFQKIQTYIQSGNIVLKTSEIDTSVFEQKVSEIILKNYGFEVPVLVIEAMDFITILENSPFNGYQDSEIGNAYYVLLKDKPENDLIKSLEQEKFENEQFVITPNCVYLTCQKGYGNAKCNNNFFERKLKVQATTRNYKTMQKLKEMAIDH